MKKQTKKQKEEILKIENQLNIVIQSKIKEVEQKISEAKTENQKELLKTIETINPEQLNQETAKLNQICEKLFERIEQRDGFFQERLGQIDEEISNSRDELVKMGTETEQVLAQKASIAEIEGLDMRL